jgi:beta-galactosidase/beta-glucuronidase
MTKHFFVFFAAVIFLGPNSKAADPIPAEKRYVISLDGNWRFKLEQALPPPRFLGTTGKPLPIISTATSEPFYRTDYCEDAKWHDLAVPGNWEMAGFSPATYNNPDNASGFYRLEFSVPSSWKGRRIKINFDGVQNGCEVWCNGQPVPVDECSWGQTNYHESGWTAWQADLTDAVKPGQENLLALRVTKNTKSVDCDSGDYFFLGGVYRPVTLFAVPATHFTDISVQTKLLPNDQAELKVIAEIANPPANGLVSMQLQGQARAEAGIGGKGQVILTQVISHPKLWSAEFPKLYSLDVDLLSMDLQNAHERKEEHWSHKIGIREVSIKDGIFYVNNVPVKLVGICRQDVFPTLGTAVNESVWRKDLSLMKAANFNAVRTSHYPYGSGFYDLCDEMGFYVADEEPFCWVDCEDTNLAPAFAQRARETVLRDKNHPCIVLWAVGNENKPGTNNNLAANITRDLDPTRPRLVSSHKADAGGANVEFDDNHYVTPKMIHENETSARRAQWPQIYLENPNTWEVRNGADYGSLDLWGAVIQRTWDELWRDDHVTGTFLWEWQDRAVADKSPTKFYDFFPTTGIQLMKVKGMVDGFRTPRPEYYHAKMAQTPIALGTNLEVLTDGVAFAVTNRYSFTQLGDLRVQWWLLRGDATLATGKTSLEMVPHSSGTVHLTLPSGALAEADTLRIAFDHPSGWNVVTCQFPLKNVDHAPPPISARANLTFPRFNFVTGKVTNEKRGWRRLHRETGELVNIRLQASGQPEKSADDATLFATPLKEVQKLEADVLLLPGTNIAGHVVAHFEEGKFSYEFKAKSDIGDVYELGWIFRGPAKADHFSWDRKAVWSYYPPDHIGRPNGVATPDSARVELTKLTRPDAFDFNSTKFDCNWAALTDGRSSGFSIQFDSEQREHVRGGVEPDGTCDLIVNRCCSPPHDISSNIVPDLYTTLKKGGRIAGSFQVN